LTLDIAMIAAPKVYCKINANNLQMACQMARYLTVAFGTALVLRTRYLLPSATDGARPLYLW